VTARGINLRLFTTAITAGATVLIAAIWLLKFN
jgi:hypothetical protein